MPKEKTICEEEFEKWWGKRLGQVNGGRFITYKEGVQAIWNQAWKTCGDKIKKSLKKK